MLALITSILKMAQDGKRATEELNDILQVIVNNPNFHAKFFPVDKSLSAQIKSWEKFYKEMFGIKKKDFSNLKIPKKKKGFDRLIIVAQGMTPNNIFNKINSLMPTWKFCDNLDTITSIRKATSDYAIWIRDRIEADEELKNKSANDLEKEGVNGITLEERLLYELKYFQETRKHLDINNATLCSGSRYSAGYVPYVCWFDGNVFVHRDYVLYTNGHLRSRAVVS